MSRQRLNSCTWNSLLRKAEDLGLRDKQLKMMAGDIVNMSEGRQVLHTSLRSKDRYSPYYREVQAVLAKMMAFSRDIRNGVRKGATGKEIKDIVNIGIGGSETGVHAVSSVTQVKRL